jgi:hypothetical protein
MFFLTMRALLIIAFTILLNSCIREIPLEMPDSSFQLAVSSIIYPEKLISLHVSYVNLFAGSSDVKAPVILGISLKEDGILVDNLKGQGPEIYSSTYPKEGSTYELTVTTDHETVTSHTIIPSKVLISKADYRITGLISQEGDKIMELSVSWEDPPSQDDYYELQLLDSKKMPYWYYAIEEIDDPILLQECDLDYRPGSFVFTDKKFSGETGTVNFRFPFSISSGHDKYVLLRSISEEYYHFMKSWYKHLYLQNTSMNVETIREDYNIFPLLFQGDPVPLYTNINQGLGVFAGFTGDLRKFKLVQ